MKTVLPLSSFACTAQGLLPLELLCTCTVDLGNQLMANLGHLSREGERGKEGGVGVKR